MKLSIFTILLFITPMVAFAQVNKLPENPDPGSCYVRCVTPNVYETVKKRVMVAPAYKKLEVVPAEFKTETFKVMVKEPTKKFIYHPAEYKTVIDTIMIKEGYNTVQIDPAQLTGDIEEIEVKPETARWEYNHDPNNCSSADPRDCMVLCYVKVPGESKVIQVQKLVRDASYGTTPVAPEYITVSKRVIAKKAWVEEIDIPAEYKTFTRTVKVKDETVHEETVPAKYVDELVEVLKKKGGVLVWEEIDCELTDYTVLPIYYELGSARLTSESKRIIDERIYSLMKAKPNIKVEIASHTDSRGSASSNMALSQRRAESVVNYLVGKGIARSRLIARGYGETRLRNRCADGVQCTEEEHQQNRRTEFRVLGSN